VHRNAGKERKMDQARKKVAGEKRKWIRKER
jgi:hypothetical protein